MPSSSDFAPANAAHNASIASFFVRLLADYVAPRDLPVAQLFEQCGLDPAVLDDADERIGYLDFLRLCEQASRHLDDPCLGLHLGQQMQPGYLGAYGFTLMSSRTAREILPQVTRYSRLAVGAGHNVIDTRDDELIRYWRLDFDDAPATRRHLDELVMASGLAMMRRIAGDLADQIIPRWASFRSSPADPAPYETYFRCPLRFGSDEDAMGFDIAYLDVPLQQGNAEVRQSLNLLCEQQLARLDTSTAPAWLRDLQKLISGSLADGAVELGEAAGKLGMAPATLRARLTARGLTYRGLVDELRHDLALSYLNDPRLSLVDIAYLLGYSEQSAFQRAFKRRTGQTPGRYRKS
jgi:AraC-like DNA-binding protein